MSKKKTNKATTYSIKLSKKHPNDKMHINGVLITGYQFKTYELPAGTNLDTPEIKAWFVFEDDSKEAAE